MNYSIIKDEAMLKDFIRWLPELEPKERYYLCLFARNKYCKELVHIKTDKAQLKRFVSDKERIFNKIQQLEIELGRYKQKEKEVPEEALALYITPNPRDMFRASVNTMVKLAQSIRDNNVSMNPHQEALSEIQKAKSRTVYVDFDLDFPEYFEGAVNREGYIANSIIPAVYQHVNPEAVTFLNTRGGLHIMVEVKKVAQEFKNKFYQGLSSIAGVDQTGDQLIPVPGCTQGMFIPHFINL
jgi:hypothetical protein